MDAEVRKRAKEVYQKLKTTIKVIPLSLQERSEKVVETAVSNDDRPDSYLAAIDTTGIYKDNQGVSYDEQGAGTSIQPFHAVGPPLGPSVCPFLRTTQAMVASGGLLLVIVGNSRILQLLACP